MTKIILDSGPVISFALNRILWIFERTKEEFGMEFYITNEVKCELVDNPLASKRFKLEALQVLSLIKKGVIKVINDPSITQESLSLLEISNSSFFAYGDTALKLVHLPEMTAIVAAIRYDADAIMIDERTTRYLIEKPNQLKNVMFHRLHTKITVDKKEVSELLKHTQGVKMIRSAEFAAVAFEKGLFDEYLPDMPNGKEVLLDALLWGLKISGCAISEKDLDILKREELKVRR
jgi:hypothetical protein